MRLFDRLLLTSLLVLEGVFIFGFRSVRKVRRKVTVFVWKRNEKAVRAAKNMHHSQNTAEIIDM